MELPPRLVIPKHLRLASEVNDRTIFERGDRNWTGEFQKPGESHDVLPAGSRLVITSMYGWGALLALKDREDGPEAFDRLVVGEFPSVQVIPVTFRNGALYIGINLQYRDVIGGKIWELTKGFVGQGESPAEAARREAFKEFGEATGKLYYLGLTYCSPSFVYDQKHCFMLIVDDQGVDLSKTDFDEGIDRIKWISLNELLSAIKAREHEGHTIEDGISQAIITKMLAHLQEAGLAYITVNGLP